MQYQFLFLNQCFITPEIAERPAPDLPNCCRKESVSSLIQNKRHENQGEESFMVKIVKLYESLAEAEAEHYLS